jgi:hypothetical protein
MISSSGRMGWQNAFLQSPCFCMRPRSTAIVVSRQLLSFCMTGRWRPLLDQIVSSRLPRTTMRNLACTGRLSSSFLTVWTFMVGMMAMCEYFAQYLASVRMSNVPCSRRAVYAVVGANEAGRVFSERPAAALFSSWR